MSEPAPVTVVIPTRDRPHRLRTAIESVLAQTLGEWELFVVDDASADPVRHLVEEVAAGDRRVRVLRLESGRGAAAARNEGAGAGAGRHVAFLDDDDAWEPPFLRRMGDALDGSGAEVAYCRRVIVRAPGDAAVPPLPDLERHGEPLRALLRGNFIDTSTALIRRDALERVGGFDPGLPRLQDWDLWLRLAVRSRFVRVDERLVTSRVEPGGISGSPDRLVAACERLAALRPSELALEPAGHADFLYTLATLLMVGGAPQQARPYFRGSLRIRPWPRRVAAAAAAVFAPGVYRAVTRIRLAAGLG